MHVRDDVCLEVENYKVNINIRFHHESDDWVQSHLPITVATTE